MKGKQPSLSINLMEGFRNGETLCLAEIYKTLYQSMLFLSLKITRNTGASEDIVEESLIKIWERRDIFFEFNVLKSYLYKTVKNSSLLWLNENSKRSTANLELSIVSFSDESESFSQILEAELLPKLAYAIEQLAPQGKQVIKMIFFEGKNTRAVAETLGISQSTVKTQKGRSIIKLKKILSSPPNYQG